MDWQELLKFGLTEGESKAYLALLRTGSSSVGPIVKESGVAYSNVYDVLQRLAEKGIVSFIVKNKTKYFQAVTPSNLYEYLKKKEAQIAEQKKQLQAMLPQLMRMQEIQPQQAAEVFLGLPGLRTAYERLFAGATRKDEDCFFYIHEEEYAEASDTFYLNLQPVLKQVKLRGITNQLGRKSDFFEKVKFGEFRYADFPIPGNIEVCRERLLIISWEKPIIGVLIYSSSMADNFHAYFEDAWKAAKK
jgi:sugar-specific transcriptional regulator TrmB